MSLMTAARPNSFVSKDGSAGAIILGWLRPCDPIETTLLRLGDGGGGGGSETCPAEANTGVFNVLCEETLPIKELGML